MQIAQVLSPGLLSGRRAVVTGAAQGIGQAIALHLASAGADLLLVDAVEPEQTAALLADADVDIRLARLDVRDRAGLSAEFARLDRIDMLATSAGVYGEPASLTELDEQELDRVLEINLKGTLWSVAAALPALRVRGGSIVAIGSAAGQAGGVASGVQYVASKGALHASVKWIARTEAAHGIVANAVAPGAVATDMIAGKRYDPGYCPLGRIGTADEIAAVAAFLCSPGAAYMTGAIVDVNGGYLMN